MTNICCGPTVRTDGKTYLCSGCRKDITNAFRKAGLAGEVIHWRHDEKQVIVNGRVTHIGYKEKSGWVVEILQ